MLELHRYRHVDWTPSPVVALAASVDGTVIAVGRGNGSIEIWIVSAGSVGWHCELTIPGKTDSCLSCLLWCPSKTSKWGRLFSAGLDGFISEWDLSTIRPKDILKSYGGSVWQMAIEPNKTVSVHVPAIAERPEDYSSLSSDDDSDDNEDDKSEGDAEDDNENERRVVIACDDGCVRMFAVKDGENMTYKKTFPHVEGRILSVAWSIDAERIFSGGSDGCIRCWDARLSREVYRITVGLGGGKHCSSLCIWSLLYLRNGTLVSGDSSGSTQFWDSQQGTLLQALTVHKADVLALAASPSQQSVFAAGADGQVVQYQHIPESKMLGEGSRSKAEIAVRMGDRWVYIGNKRNHSHDVNALVVASSPVFENGDNSAAGNVKSSRRNLKKVKNAWVDPNLLNIGQMEIPMLVSGGNDAKLFTYPANAFLAFHPHDVCHAPQRTPISLASKQQNGLIMMAQHEHHLEIWRIMGCGSNPIDFESAKSAENKLQPSLGKRKRTLGSSHHDVKHKTASGNKNGITEHEDYGHYRRPRPVFLGKASGSPPELLATIKCKSAENISCSALSDCGQFVAFSDQSKPRLFQLEQQPKAGMTEWGIMKRRLPENIPSAHCMVFCSSDHLILSCSDLALWVVDIHKCAVIQRIEIEIDKGNHTGVSPITSLCTSQDGVWLAASNARGVITVFDLKTFRQHWHVPPLDGGSVTAAAFHPGSDGCLVVATCDNVLHVLDVETKMLGEWSRKHGTKLPQAFLEFPGGIQGLSFCSFRKTTTVVAYSSKAMCFVDFTKPVLCNGFDSGQKSGLSNGTSLSEKLPDGIDSGKECVLANGAGDGIASGQKSGLSNGASLSKKVRIRSKEKIGLSNGSRSSEKIGNDIISDSGEKAADGIATGQKSGLSNGASLLKKVRIRSKERFRLLNGSRSSEKLRNDVISDSGEKAADGIATGQKSGLSNGASLLKKVRIRSKERFGLLNGSRSSEKLRNDVISDSGEKAADGIATGQKSGLSNGASLLKKVRIRSKERFGLLNGSRSSEKLRNDVISDSGEKAADGIATGQKSGLSNGASLLKKVRIRSKERFGLLNGSRSSEKLRNDVISDSGGKSDLSNGITCSEKLENRHSNRANRNFVFVSFKDPVLFVGYASEASILIIERTWLEAISKLPPPVYRHKFGK